MIGIKRKGDWDKTENFLTKAGNVNLDGIFHKYGRKGVDALISATPVNTGLTARSWRYRIKKLQGRTRIEWYNTNVQNGVSIALLIQYGHGTGGGGLVTGRDYINPALKSIFDNMADEIWEEVTSQ